MDLNRQFFSTLKLPSFEKVAAIVGQVSFHKPVFFLALRFFGLVSSLWHNVVIVSKIYEESQGFMTIIIRVRSFLPQKPLATNEPDLIRLGTSR